MPNKMLVDASHPEETRVVVVRGNRIEEFDFESQDKKQLRGNIYLARVTRVEPSLQAAFVEYGGNRHGFLAFSEIHPDYYQIPVADRQALVRAEAEEAKAEEEADESQNEQRGRKRRRSGSGRRGAKGGSKASGATAESDDSDSRESAETIAAAVDTETVSEEVRAANGNDDRHAADDDDEVDTVGAEDALDEAESRRRPVRRSYKIQEVVKRRQILLVQVVKEERGNKGAALTTYLSLAGRYSVLMPNTARGGGISRKITNIQDRKRLKEIVRDLDVPEGMGVILRTAGANRTKAEVKRDYEYLMRLWEKVRNLTLESTAPALVYEEGSLIKRSVRDLYNKDIDEILVAGEEGYREAKDFMRMLMPSHAKVVQPYRDSVPIFARNGIEAQLDRMLQPQVNLKSGGYIIINQTEALVAIDVNSGRSTKEHSIEDTALQTNLEAADEVARQLRLRDLAGLIVIDFIDMEENRNNRAVEKRLKECLKNDRARIQVGRISHFGLLEMSRQRIRTSVLESTMQPCPHCGGTGHVRSESSVALLVVRAIEEYLLKDARNDITVRTPTSTALYLLNQKRSNLTDLESRFGVRITVEADDEVGTQHYAIARGAVADKSGMIEQTPTLFEEIDTDEDEADADAEQDMAADGSQAGEEGGRKRRRRRRRRGGRDRQAAEQVQADDADEGSDASDEQEPERERMDVEADAQDSGERKKRRRGKRGGRRNRRDEEETDETKVSDGQEPTEQPKAAADEAAMAPEAIAASASPSIAISEAAADEGVAAEEAAPADDAGEKKKPARKPRRTTKKAAAKAETAENGEDQADDKTQAEPVGDAGEASAPAKPRRPRRSTKAAESEPVAEPVVSSSLPAEEDAPRKKGWWQKKGFF